jgi:hypothetical protein
MPTEETYERIMDGTASHSIRLACMAAYLDDIATEEAQKFVRTVKTQWSHLERASECRKAAHALRRIAARLE